MLTRTELETLAVMIHSAGQHMATVRTGDGGWVWSAAADGAANFTAAYTEMLEGFYALQADIWADLVHVHA
jgi:hypothetical protein